jgi:Cu2+-exporting ATPase
VIAGSVNTSSPLYVQISQTGQHTRLAGIVRLLDQALAEKPRLAVAADRFASWFVALLLLAAAGSYIAWHFIEPARALWIMVAVLVVSCPCALSLATPAALTAATGHLAALGLLTTRGHALETLARVSDVVFDKTGTLTHGDMRCASRCSWVIYLPHRRWPLRPHWSRHRNIRWHKHCAWPPMHCPATSRLDSIPGRGGRRD